MISTNEISLRSSSLLSARDKLARAVRRWGRGSLKRYKKILVQNTFELLQVSMGKDLGATLERLGLVARKSRGKKKPPPT